MLLKEEIREKINYVLSSAWESRHPIRLEQLPYSVNSDYDTDIHTYINLLRSAIRRNDKESFNLTIDELIEHYYINQENYNF